MIPTTAKRFLSRYYLPLAVSLVTVVTALAPLDPLVRILNPHAPIPGTLHRSLAYLFLGPVSTAVDALTLLSPAQDAVMFGTCLLIFGSVFAYRQRQSGAAFFSLETAAFFAKAIAITVVLIEALLVAPRPMAALRLDDPDLIAVDFHSHTAASHDGRPGFDADANREWHRKSGYDVAYVTDHRTYAGALAAERRNPATGGEGTILLPGIELRDGDEHVIAIGADPVRSRIPSADLHDAELAPLEANTSPLLILSMPGNDTRIPASELGKSPLLAGIEISDGSPRGLAQTSGHASVIQRLGATRSLSDVSGSDNHGWGRTAPAWSILRIPHWRDLSTRSLDLRIRQSLTRPDGRGVEVLERRRVPPASTSFGAALSAVSVGVVLFRTLDWPERLSWIAWSWALVLVAPVARRARGWWRAVETQATRGHVSEPLIDVAATEQVS